MSPREELIGEDKAPSFLLCSVSGCLCLSIICILHHVLSAWTLIPTLSFNRRSPREGCSHSIGGEGCSHSGGGIFFPGLSVLYEGPITALGHQSWHPARLALSRDQGARLKVKTSRLGVQYTSHWEGSRTLLSPASAFHSGELCSRASGAQVSAYVSPLFLLI